MAKTFKFVNEANNDFVFYATEGDAVYERVTTHDRFTNRCLGEVNVKTLEPVAEKLSAAEKRALKATAEAEAPAAANGANEATEAAE